MSPICLSLARVGVAEDGLGVLIFLVDSLHE